MLVKFLPHLIIEMHYSQPDCAHISQHSLSINEYQWLQFFCMKAPLYEFSCLTPFSWFAANLLWVIGWDNMPQVF